MSVKWIQHKLGRVVRAERQIWFLRAAFALVAYAAVFAAIHFALDWSLRPSPAGRAVLTAGLVAGMLYALRREVWTPWRTFPSRYDVALEIERSFPALEGRFLSAHQLVANPQGGSPALIERLVDETTAAAQSLDFEKVPDRVRRNRNFALAVMALTAWGIFMYGTYTGRYSTPVWLSRLIHPLADFAYPTRTMVIIERGDQIVARGSDVKLEAHAAGLIPPRGSLWIQRGTKWTEQRVAGSGREFAFVQKPALESFFYYWRLGDGESGRHRVTVVVPPQVREIGVRYEYPAYTRRAPQSASGGNIQALPGTKARLTIRTNKPIREGALLLDGSKRIALQGAGETTYTVAFEVAAARAAYRIYLKDSYGFENKDPMQYAIEPEEDLAPRVELGNLQERRYVTPYAALPIEVHGRDDYGITKMQLHFTVAGERQESIDVPVRENRSDVLARQSVGLEPWKLAPGTEIVVWASALDNRAVGPPQSGESPKVTLEVVSPEEMLRLMREKMEGLFPRLEAATQEALESKTAIEDTVRNGASSDEPTTGGL
jgi:hypothetical protein